MVSKSLSRIEANREVRRILVKNGIDTTKLQYSCSARSVSMTGGLYKDGGTEVGANNIQIMFQEISRLGLQVQCDLENWTITEGMISKKGNKNDSPEANNSKNPNSPTPNKTAEHAPKKATA